MKKLILLTAFINILYGCGENGNTGEEQPCQPIGFYDVYPVANATNEPVLVYGEGFYDNTTVHFGNVNAPILDHNEEYISTRVPSGLNGLVEIILRNGDNCVRAMDFEVLNQLPAGLPASPPVYVIPSAGFSFPLQVGMDETMYLENVYDDTHKLNLAIFRIKEGSFDIPDFSTEYFKGTENPVTGTVDLEANSILMNIDRSGTAFPDEQLAGGFYTLEMEIDGEKVVDNFLIVFSTITKRQYLFR